MLAYTCRNCGTRIKVESSSPASYEVDSDELDDDELADDDELDDDELETNRRRETGG
jgi:hypothetical protein